MTSAQSIGFIALVATLSLRCATAGGTCMDGETCCIQAHPGNPAACGLTAAEAATLMSAGATASGTHPGVDVDVNDCVEDPRLPEWKNRCIRSWNDCKDGMFSGPCTDCLRRCEGRHDWPLDMCRPSKSKKR